MPDIYQPSPAHYPQLISIWEAAVRATHHFLTPSDLLYFKKMVGTYLPAMEVYCINHDDNIAGFMGIGDGMVQALFIHPAASGKGLGTLLMQYAIDEKNIRRVDVNEQNEAALGFYQHLGFVVTGRTELDSTGRPYPILMLQLP